MYKISYTNKQSGHLGYITKVIRGYPKYTDEGKEFKSLKVATNNLNKCLEFKNMIDKMQSLEESSIEFKIIEI